MSGTVLDAKTGAAVAGATIRTDSGSTTSNASGGFTIGSIPPGGRALLYISGSGYADHVIVIQVSANTNTRVSPQLVPVAASQLIDVTAGGVVNVPGSTGQVTFQPGSLAAAGTVTVNVTPINASLNPNFLPGDFTDTSTGAPLESYGAITVTAVDAAGSNVAVAPGKLYTIRIPVSTRGALFQELPLYYFDPATSRWTQEGTARLGGPVPDQYFEAQVTRLGTWTVNAPYDVILVAGCVQDQQNARVAGARLAADGIDYTGTTSILSDSAGNYLLAVKKGGQAVVAARSEGKTSNSLVVGPSSTDVSLASTCLVLTDVAHNVTFRLTWGEVPRDVDGHLWLPDGSHVFYFLKGDLNGHPWASIDVDDTTSFGPEIITIRKLMVGTYTYIVNNFSENIPPGLTGSPTRVELNISGDSTAFTPPPDEGAALWWTAFTFTVDARCNVSVTPINTWSVAKPEPAPNTPTAVYCTPL